MKKFLQKFGLFCGSETYDSMPYKFAIGDKVKIIDNYESKNDEKYIGEITDFSYYTVFGIRKEEYEVKWFKGYDSEDESASLLTWFGVKELEYFDPSIERDYKLESILNNKESI